MTTKPDKCAAVDVDALMVCERCGLEWPADGQKPPCEPINFDRMRERLLDQVRDLERGYELLKDLKGEGMPVSTALARRRLEETRKILKLLDLVVFTPALKTAVQKANRGERFTIVGEGDK
jgi:hypothetical protein